MGIWAKGKTGDAALAQLLVDVYMGEYTALREEILLHMRRVSNLVVYSIGGAGAIVGSAAITSFADRPDVFASMLFLVSAVLGLVAATCIGAQATILEINGYLAERADELRDVLIKAAGDRGRIPTNMFAWENLSISRPASSAEPAQIFTNQTAAFWGGSVLEILVIIVLAIAALVAAGSICAQQEAARTLVTACLFAMNLFAVVGIAVWTKWALSRWTVNRGHPLP